MRLSDLKKFDLVYLGTPYTKYAGGICVAYFEACKITGRLLLAGIKAHSPIVNSHPISLHGGINPLDHSIWLPIDKAMMDKSDAMIVAMMPGWEQSYGIQVEMVTFAHAGKPIYLLDPDDLSVAPCPPELIEQIRAERTAL